ncbi:hypothetical protein LJC60_09125 [Ruminococcaceae bacterium OttesenSCG-928-D13]|nr:hypothetical protein [Ruminococcaceae bacterium OttesenSCG-928-D13]
MKITNNGSIAIEGKNYTLTYNPENKFYASLVFGSGLGGDFLIPSACDRDEAVDEFIDILSHELTEAGGAAKLTFTAQTTLWEKVEYTFTCTDDRVLYGYKVFGSGKIDNVRFFEGFLKDDSRRDIYFYPYFCGPNRKLSHHRPYKEFAHSSTPGFTDVFSFGINSSDKRWFKYYETTMIRVNSNRYYEGGDWLSTPPPYLYLLSDRDHTDCVTMGLVAKPGQNRFLKYEYLGGEGFGLYLDYDGYTKVDGSWETPQIVFEQTGPDVYEGLDKYCDYLREIGVCETVDRTDIPAWWKKPIFGGWGEQVFHSNRWSEYYGEQAQNWDNDNCHLFCTQAAYNTMLETLESKGVDPTILIVDNRWFQENHQFDVDEVLWPDMKGFIKEQHAKGRKVILWTSPWHYCHSGTGLDVPIEYQMIFDERMAFELELDTDIFYKACKREMKKVRKELVIPPSTLTEPTWKFFVDPQNEKYEKLLREKIDYLLSPQGLDADGFEFDYTHFLPMNRGLLPVGGERDDQLYGAEILHALLAIYHDQAKRSKKDALIISHTFNAYFNDVTDMLRLQDIYTDRASVVPQMEHRAKIAKAVMPGCAIHTDQHPMPSLAAWREYAEFQPSIGNPCLYYVTGIETTHEEFTDEDFAMLRRTWGEYSG